MGHIAPTHYQNLLNVYRNKASWAIWDGKVCNIMPVHEAGLAGKLHNREVLVGLNLSRGLTGNPPWQNFHDCRPKSRDHRLAWEVHPCHPFYGGYMTDFLHIPINSSSAQIKQEILNGTLAFAPAMVDFITEMTDLKILPCKENGAHRIVVFGDVAQWIYEVFLIQTRKQRNLIPSLATVISQLAQYRSCFRSFNYLPMTHYGICQHRCRGSLKEMCQATLPLRTTLAGAA